MNRHVTTEQLSAYLDRELGIAEMRHLDAHFNACSDCGARLVSMQRVLNGLGRVQRAAAPPAIAQQIRRQIAAEAATPVSPLRRLLSLLSGLALQPHLRTSAAMALTLVLCISLVGHGVGGGEARQQKEKKFVVETYPGAPLSLPRTKSQVAGREFVLTEAGWVQLGLEGEQPGALVDSNSPEGQALLTEYSDLEVLLADGSPVVLRYNLETVELRGPHQGVRMLGFEPQPAYHTADLRLLSA
ncbi:MAG TPA: zf-HC2 domain-containing protein [Thermoanaerobaculia bacterium]|nr:zf-HC2 domain-containing protein [Thermoanaerobaculia bacterium]